MLAEDLAERCLSLKSSILWNLAGDGTRSAEGPAEMYRLMMSSTPQYVADYGTMSEGGPAKGHQTMMSSMLRSLANYKRRQRKVLRRDVDEGFSSPWNLADGYITSAEGPMEVPRSEIVDVGVHVVGMIDDASPTTTQRLLAMIEPLSSQEQSDIIYKKGSF